MPPEIDSFLKEWLPASGKLLYFPNPGNAGDALIAAATWQCFDRLSLRPKLSEPKKFPRHTHVILGGGGNLVPPYHDMADALQACLEMEVESCLLLPHTIRGNEALLYRLDKRFTLLCRDLTSLEHVRRYAPLAQSLLVKDMALTLDIDELQRRSRSLSHRLALWSDRDWLKHRQKWKKALSRQHPDVNGRLTILRGDVEARTPPGEQRARDLMGYYFTSGSRHKRAACDQVAWDIVTLLRQARTVRTDRLHVALPAALLGLEVEIIDNNYGKLSAVWRTSLAGKYPKTKLAPAPFL